MTDLQLLRIYEPHELGDDGYPHLWHAGLDHATTTERLGHDLVDPQDTSVGPYGVKHLVRTEAGDRCVRCGHPYLSSRTEWETGPQLKLSQTSDLLSGIDYDEPPATPGGLSLPAAVRTRVLWSPCDDRCMHLGPARWRHGDGPWTPWNDGAGIAAPGGLAERGYQVQAAWRILTVHHLNGRKHDLRWWNLAALCQRCHLVIQRKVQMERVYPFEHSDWFKPYAAGWYSYAYEGRNLTRAEVEADMDRYLALERMA